MLQQNYPDLDEISPKSDAIKIVGITYINDYINREEQNQLINVIDREEWSTVLKRRVQYYGYKYNYKEGVLTSSIYLGDLPDWAQNLANRLSADGLTANVPDQLIRLFSTCYAKLPHAMPKNLAVQDFWALF